MTVNQSFLTELATILSQFPQQNVSEISKVFLSARKIHLFGNGGSGAICSHVNVDLLKACGLESHVYTDPALITCFSNDFGYENAYSEMLKRYASSGEAVVAISSKGESKNIFNLVNVANFMQCKTIVFTGFDEKNSIRLLPADIQIYINSHNYNIVESVHQSILLSVCEELMKK
jgi:D-sedoheptulose 7-phosphate isomerase